MNDSGFILARNVNFYPRCHTQTVLGPTTFFQWLLTATSSWVTKLQQAWWSVYLTSPIHYPVKRKGNSFAEIKHFGNFEVCVSVHRQNNS